MPLTITHAKSNTIGDFTGTVTVFNSAGTTTTAVATDLVRPVDWNSAHQVTFQLTGSEIASLFSFGNGLSSTAGADGISAGFANNPYFEPFALPNTNSTLSAPGIGTWYLDGPYVNHGGFASGQINCLVSNAAGFLGGTTFSSASTGSMTKSQTFYHNLAAYSYGTGANSSRLETAWTARITLGATQSMGVSSSGTTTGVLVTNALTLNFPAQFNISGGVTYSSTAVSGTASTTASTAASSFADSLITGAVAFVSGARMDILPLASTMADGVFWLAHQFSSSSTSAGTNYTQGTMFQTHSRLGLLENAIGAHKRLGVSVSNSTSAPKPFHGFFATTSTAAPSPINTSDMRATTGLMYWNYNRTTY